MNILSRTLRIPDLRLILISLVQKTELAKSKSNLRKGIRNANDPSLEWPKDPFWLVSIRHLLGVHIPDVVTPRFSLFTIRIKA
jgi:hypothetical protein